MKKMKLSKTGIASVFALVMTAIFFLGACNDQKKSAKDEEELTTLKVSFAPTSYISILTAIAQEEGFYRQAGLNVELTQLGGGGNMDSVAALVTGKIDVLTNPGAIGTLIAIDQAQPVVVIGGTKGGDGILGSRPSEEHKYKELTTENLAGVKIAVKRTASSDIAFRGYLAATGVDLSKITFVEFDSAPSSIVATLKGECDVVLVASNRYNAIRQGLSPVMFVDEIAPNYSCCRILVTADNLKKYRSQYVSLLAANIKAYKIYKNDQTRTLEIAKQYYQLDEDLLVNELFVIGHTDYSPDPRLRNLKNLWDSAVTIEYLQGQENLFSHVDTSLYEDALNRVLKEYPADPFFLDLQQEFIRDNKNI
jgi:NitT/TauT family transport system substrate-binding protein